MLGGLALGAVWLCQLVLFYQHERQMPVGIEIKPLLTYDRGSANLLELDAAMEHSL